jgi:exoribonuclease R
MNYYEQYETIKSETDYSIIQKIEDLYYANDKEVTNNRALHGDIVYIKDNKVINIKERKQQTIVGIINLNAVHKMKINNKIYHIFQPLNKKYEKFYVGLNTNKYTHSIYVIIKFRCWETNSDYPYGDLIDIIGSTSNKENELIALLHNYEVFQKKINIPKDKINEDMLIIEKLQKDKKCDYKIFTIDPLHSKDLDDGFHFRKTETHYELGIHIAYPQKFLQEYLLNILKRFTTIYTYKNINLIPDIYSENLCSLLQKKYRKTLSILIKFDLDKNYVNYEIKEATIFITKNYTYDDFQEKYFNHSEHTQQTQQTQINQQNNYEEWIKLSEYYFKTTLDAHSIVEKWMIEANKIIANHLIKNNFETIILRVFEEKETKFNTTNNILNQIIHQYNQEAAIYQIFNKEEPEKFKHSNFNDSYYTHFTSPIRRSIDFYNQYLITNKLNQQNQQISKEEIIDIVENYNKYEKKLKKFYRTQNLLNFIYIHNHDVLETEAFIIQIKKNKLKLYLIEEKLEVQHILFPYKFLSYYQPTYSNDNNEISYIINNIFYEYKVYQKIKVQLYFYPTEININDKIKIKIH